MEEQKKPLFESREYQVELFELAITKNLILYLPTGSGKTFIASLLIQYFGKISDTITRPIENGGKRIFFLVNTVALVQQQALQIQTQSAFIVGQYSGDMGVDLWKRDTWLTEINEKQVFVMTVQIFLDLILNTTVSLNNVSLIIFDECHRAVSNHPMRQVMQQFKDVPSNKQPRILGLTATLLNGNINPSKVSEQIRSLENTFMASIATSINEEMVAMYSTNPRESKVTYHPCETTGFCFKICNKILEEAKKFFHFIQVEDEAIPSVKPAGCKQIDANKRKLNKNLKNVINDIQVNMEQLGLYGGTMAILAHLIQMSLLLPNAQLGTAKLLYQTISTDCVFLRKLFEKADNTVHVSNLDLMYRISSDKSRKLFDILKQIKPTDSAIVFVERRFTAKVLYYMIKNAVRGNPQLKNIKANFIVGYNIGNPFKDTRENYLQRCHNTKIMNQFNQGELNVLIASNVVEEGVDISQCNIVVMFDVSKDFRSYIQSKGRARDKSGKYIMMVDSSDRSFDSKYASFCEVERILKQILYGGKSRHRTSPSEEELDEKLFAEIPGLEPYKPLGENGPTITALSAVTLINRYFATLKRDKFTKVTPFWWLKKEGVTNRCFLQLPMESKVRDLVEGTCQGTKEDAKRSVALEACKKLHQFGELDDKNLLPVGLNDPVVKDSMFTPKIDDSEITKVTVEERDYIIGSKRYKRLIEKKWAVCLTNCAPKPNKEVFVHVLEMKPVFTPPPDNPRLASYHQILSQGNYFAMISTKQLPNLASFPLYLSVGELEGKIKDVYQMILNDKELSRISSFHGILFESVLGIAKRFMIRDFTNTQNGYLIAPVVLDSSQKYIIDWNAVEEAHRPFPSINKPSKENREKLKLTEENYLERVVSPWYRTVPLQKYIVTKVCHDMSEKSPFPSESYATYKEYFHDKYQIDVVQTNQPLLEVRALSNRIKSTIPRALSKQFKRKIKEENEDFEVWLIPEFCVVYPLQGRYWLKAQLLPSVLHRISQLCMAEELRCIIAVDTSVGLTQLPQGFNWDKLQGDSSLSKEKESKNQEALTPLIFSKNCNSYKPVQTFWQHEEEPLDIERHMDSVSLFDLSNYSRFISQPLLDISDDSSSNGSKTHRLTSSIQRPIPKMKNPPPLLMLQNTTAGIGPQQVELLQAITTAGANDFISCERLETLGDSFLKLAISLMLFETQPDMLEGNLTNLKGRIVGNKNLYFCGREKSLAALLEVDHFSPSEEWVPPGFCVEHSVQQVLRTASLNPNCLYDIDIPDEERSSGRFSQNTLTLLNDILFTGEDIRFPQTNTVLNQQAYTNKNVSDAVEAILGVYLKSCGIFGAHAVMNWFGVTCPSLSTQNVFTQTYTSPAKGKGDPNGHLTNPELLEKTIHYKFKDRNYLLQALSHPSYSRNQITICYQRLEFLGDAIIDFLITVHIFEKCTSLSPGDLTDLRSALVNNITLACITVRNQLHKYLLHYSTKLNECLMRFIKHQENRDHAIDCDILFLYEEQEVNMAEAVDVPKALGDIFEALIGAVYLDSGKDLNVTWLVVYNLMKDEIEKFHKDVPKNHVRMLYESECAPLFSTPNDAQGAIMVMAEIVHKGQTIKFSGFGDNKKQAKRAAAKHALRYIRSPSIQ